jgi:large repetitive protein
MISTNLGNDAFTAAQGVLRTTITGNVALNDAATGGSTYGYGWGPTGLGAGDSSWTTFSNGKMVYVSIVQSGYVTFPTSSSVTLIPTANGSVLLNTDGTFTYTSNDGFTGTETFQYSIYNQSIQAIDTRTVSFTVLPSDGMNWAPVAEQDTYSFALAAGEKFNSATTGSVLANDTDGADTITTDNNLSVVASTFLTAQGGVVSLNANGHFTYTPPRANFSGADSFKYTVKDGLDASTFGTVNLNVESLNSAPTAQNIALVVAHGGSVSGSIIPHVADANGDALTAAAGEFISQNGGKLVVNADGTFSYTAVRGKLLTDVFDYTVSDGKGGSTTATISFNVTNSGPVAVQDKFSADYGKSAAGNVLLNDKDAEGDALTVTPVAMQATANGFFTIDAAGGFKYTPKFGFHGTESVNYTVKDALGAETTATITVTIRPSATAQYGTANDDALNGSEGDDTIYAQGGKDTVNGNGGNDHLFGGDSSDAINGGDGVDVIDGGTGADKVTGGAGNDVFVLRQNAGSSVDKIVDFKAGDKLALIAADLGLAPGTGTVPEFVTSMTAPPTGSARLLYNAGAKTLYLDHDGDAATQNAVLTSFGSKVTLTAQDFVLM